MARIHRSRPEIVDLVTLAVALDRDEQRTRAERLARDGRVGRQIGVQGRTLSALAWLDAACAEDTSLRALKQRLVVALHWSTGLVLGAGLILGWGVALGVFYYEGSGRVNAIGVLAVFVFLPALLLLPFILAALPGRILRLLPGASALAAMARGLSPGKLAGVVRRWLPRETRAAWERVAGGVSAQQTLYAGVQKWLVLRWSQLFAIGFQIAALSVAMYLIVFTDLAFGWSTTLASAEPGADAAWVHSLTSMMAAPWGWLWQGADPSLSLIQETRYFRAATNSVTLEQAARLGEWWPFIMMSILLYGWAPRVLTAGIAELCLRRATRLAFNATPGLAPLLRRLHQTLVRTTAREPEDPVATLPEADQAPAPAPAHGNYGIVINWSAVPVNDAELQRRLKSATLYHAGGALAPGDDRALVQQLGAQPGGHDVAIIVKAWEPPMMEFVDFVRALRSAIGEGRMIQVLPVRIDDPRGPATGDPAQLQIWRRRLASVGDPWLRVDAFHEAVSA